MKALFDWIDDRTGYRRLLHEALNENVPGGARWRYVWGSTLTFAFFLQVVTGVVLWMAYAPSSHSAWESVFYIQNEMWGGWLLRGIHHYTAQFMTLLLALHLLQVVIDGAYKAPREVNFWTGILLLLLVMGLSLTGYLLPWDQKGYWATKVATSIAAVAPVIGPDLQRLIVGGADYGHHTLTRFFALHAGVLPGLIIALIFGHIYLFRRHGVKSKRPHRRPDAPFWPDQVFCDVVACLAILAAVLFLTFWTHGAGLSSPADPAEQYEAARPEWYFMFLFEILKYFPASRDFLGLNLEVWGAMILPGIVIGLIVAMPLIGRWRIGHRFNLGVLAMAFGIFGVFTWLAYAKDAANPAFQIAKEEAERQSQRVLELARIQGIPQTGALTLLHNDPLTQGPKLFAQHCASCHRFDGHDGTGREVQDPQSAPDLKGFASREWLTGFLDPEKILTAHYYGGTKFAERSRMVRFVERDVAEFDDAQKEMLRKVVIALSAEAQLPGQAEADAADAAVIAEGKKLLEHEDMRCTECHQFYFEDEDADAPNLTGYASREWIMSFIADPAHPRFYGDRNDRMPSFGKEETLNEKNIGLLADWLRGDWPRSDGQVAAASN
ncbi:MAG TPA: menaquinol-cytochrome C reductase [Verrucomicrobiales bacterium]|nr:menaquinol-cytochrome C reductase [Verrucomicrobiales bacterium]